MENETKKTSLIGWKNGMLLDRCLFGILTLVISLNWLGIIAVSPRPLTGLLSVLLTFGCIAIIVHFFIVINDIAYKSPPDNKPYIVTVRVASCVLILYLLLTAQYTTTNKRVVEEFKPFGEVEHVEIRPYPADLKKHPTIQGVWYTGNDPNTMDPAKIWMPTSDPSGGRRWTNMIRSYDDFVKEQREKEEEIRRNNQQR